MYRREKYSISLFGLILLLASGQAASTAYYGYDDFGGSWSDAEKTPSNTEDDDMCWAAAASNVLDWTGWGHVAGLGNADDIFGYFQDHWTDNGGNPVFAWDWWFDGTNDGPSTTGWSQVDVAGGGFWSPTYNLSDYLLYTLETEYALSTLDALLHNGYGVTLGLGGAGAHSITAWGFEYDTQGYYKGIYVTDSDDDKNLNNPPNSLKYYDVVYNNMGTTGDITDDRWYLQNYYSSNGWFITQVSGLKKKVPEPSVLVLMATGIAGFTGLRRRYCRR